MSSGWRLKPRLRAFRRKGRLRGLQTSPSLTSALVTGSMRGRDSLSLRRQALSPSESEALRRGFSRQPSNATQRALHWGKSGSPLPVGERTISSRANFSAIRYAQCWEDADVLLAGLDVQPGDRCLSIASAGDNTLALLAKSPGYVLALDVSDAQLACLALRVAAYRALEHPELLELMGSRPSTRREELYLRCRSLLTADERRFWDTHLDAIRGGIGGAGKFERYFRLFRERVLPLVESRERVARLLASGALDERRAFYVREWDTWRWRLLFRLFFSRVVLGRLGRDPEFFAYVEGSVANRLLLRTRYALTELDPAENPYVQWILTGTHQTALPYALRPENFAAIRANLDRLEWRRQSLEEYLATAEERTIDRFNLSDVFEYVSREQYAQSLTRLAAVGRPGGRLLYWNMLAPRGYLDELAHRLWPLADLAERLHHQDKAFFYSALIIEEIVI